MTESTVFVVEDDKAVRESLCWLIDSVGFAVEAFSSAQGFLESFDASRSGCLVLDVRLPGMSGLELQERLRGEGVTLPAVVITGHGDVTSAVRAMKAGAIDFLEKPFSDQLLLERIRFAVETDQRNRRQRLEQEEVAERIRLLTPRERQVMEMVIDGKANKEIAAQFGLSPKTVEVHRSNLMVKMRAKNVADLVRLALTPQRA